MSSPLFKFLTRNSLLKRAKRLKIGWSQAGGRAASGRITSFKKGPFKYKRVYRFVDFWRRLRVEAFVVALKADNFRTGTLSLLFYQTGVAAYTLIPDGISIGDKLKLNYLFETHGVKAHFWGNSLPMREIAEGSFVFNVELWPNYGAQLCRSAGAYAVLLSKQVGYVTIRCRSGWHIVVPENCYATLGVAPNYKQIYRILRLAGLRRNLGRRPTVRGVAMNPVDHPHGGGRGKTSGARCAKSPWGRVTKSQKTVLSKNRLRVFSKRFR